MTPQIIVVDASVAIKRVVTEAGSDRATILFRRLIDEPSTVFVVPDLFYAECANILWKRVKRGETTPELARINERFLRDLPLCVFSLRDISGRGLELALQYDLSVYDGCYAALAEQLAAPLVTADEKLVRKLIGAAFKVVSLSNWTV